MRAATRSFRRGVSTAGRDLQWRLERRAEIPRSSATWRRAKRTEQLQHRVAMLTRRCLHVLLMLGACLPAQAQPQPRAVAAVQDPLARMNESVDALTRRSASVVQHQWSAVLGPRRSSAPPSRSSSTAVSGSGFVIDLRATSSPTHPWLDRRAARQIVLPDDNADGSLADGAVEQDPDHPGADYRHHH